MKGNSIDPKNYRRDNYELSLFEDDSELFNKYEVKRNKSINHEECRNNNYKLKDIYFIKSNHHIPKMIHRTSDNEIKSYYDENNEEYWDYEDSVG